MLASFGLILIYIGFIVFIVWISLNIAKAHLIGNSVKVSVYNFPEIYKVIKEVKGALDYRKDIPVYIVEEGSVNAFLGNFFKTKFIILNSELVKDMSNEETNINQMKWIIGRFVGALRAKHYRLDILRIIIESIEKIKIFNFFILPYERATQYTGDNIGLLVCENVEDAFIAFDKFMVGNELAKRVRFEGIVTQAHEIHGSLFAFLARMYSTHPHQVNRYLNLLGFARIAFPEQFKKFVSKYGENTTLNIDYLLPYYR